jgi:5-methylcytosine-specific restriction endonuclease McrA
MSHIGARMREEVRARAGRRCEYCLVPEDLAFAPHQLDHVIAEKHGGETVLENLALCCSICNRRKGSDLSTLDPVSGELRAREALVRSGRLWIRGGPDE